MKTPLVHDDFLPVERRAEVYEYLCRPGWMWGWRSNSERDKYRFFHKHFAGELSSDKRNKDGSVAHAGSDCAQELKDTALTIWLFWNMLENFVLRGHTLVRCYANGLQYGSDGTLHTDSVVPWSYTTIYYPHPEWYPDWGGETVFFNAKRDDIIAAVYPKPGRLVIFPGTMPHVARGLSRTCPLLRITLMFKTEFDANGAAERNCGDAGV